MNKGFLLISGFLMLVGCAGPRGPYYHWRLHNADILFPDSDPNVLYKYLDRQKKDMKDCGMDFVLGESDDPEVNLCMESKGWYLKDQGPVCEESMSWNEPICIQWRKKHSPPDVKPWGCKGTYVDPICKQTGSQR